MICCFYTRSCLPVAVDFIRFGGASSSHPLLSKSAVVHPTTCYVRHECKLISSYGHSLVSGAQNWTGNVSQGLLGRSEEVHGSLSQSFLGGSEEVRASQEGLKKFAGVYGNVSRGACGDKSYGAVDVVREKKWALPSWTLGAPREKLREQTLRTKN